MRNMRNRKPISFIVVLCLLLSMASMTTYADEYPTTSLQADLQPAEIQTEEENKTTFADMSGHWASRRSVSGPV